MLFISVSLASNMAIFSLHSILIALKSMASISLSNNKSSKFLRPLINLVSTFIFFYQTGAPGAVKFHVKTKRVSRNMLWI